MENKLMYVGITHEMAPVAERAYFALSLEQKEDLIRKLKGVLSIRSLIVLTTCNRTEIYFESDKATPDEVRDVLLSFVKNLHDVELDKTYFHLIDHSVSTINHLLQVANGLRSAVVGDKQIITQIKEAYQQALQKQNQGSLLERAFQAVFRSHKRVYAESLYKQGSTSTAYSSLKMAEEFFGKQELKNQAVLVVGAGQISEDVLRYLPKFQFGSVFISNRTSEKAENLAKKYKVNVYSWEHVENGDFTDFDVVITAVSNRKHLVDQVEETSKKRLWIDLAMPSNVNAKVENRSNKVYNIDEVTRHINSVSDAQLKAIPTVEAILKEELLRFTDWLEKDNIRTFLRAYKHQVRQHLLEAASRKQIGAQDTDDTENFIEILANKLVRECAKILNSGFREELISDQIGTDNFILNSEKNTYACFQFGDPRKPYSEAYEKNLTELLMDVSARYRMLRLKMIE
ncbi:MAG: glutamyl-tRNA reductase [Bacteroidota bacterium]